MPWAGITFFAASSTLNEAAGVSGSGICLTQTMMFTRLFGLLRATRTVESGANPGESEWVGGANPQQGTTERRVCEISHTSLIPCPPFSQVRGQESQKRSGRWSLRET